MATITEKRSQERLTLESSFTIHHKGSACRVVDISSSGISVTYIERENWPGNITLEFSLNAESKKKGQLKCRTVWETTMDFYKTRSDEVVRRRGLEFMDPQSGNVEKLLEHLKGIVKEQ